MARYMVVERFRGGHSDRVYARFHQQGRMLPDGLAYIDSWLSADETVCYQLMQTDRPETFDKWITRWNDLVDFEVIALKEQPNGSTT